MGDADPPVTTSPVALSRTAVVCVVGTNLFLSSELGAHRIALGPHRLHALAALAAGDEAAAAEHLARQEPGSADLLDQLADSGYLRPGPTQITATPGEPMQPDDLGPIPTDAELLLPTPTLFRVAPTGFEALDHFGRLRARLSARQLLAAAHFGKLSTIQAAADAQRTELGDDALDDAELADLVSALRRADLLHAPDPTTIRQMLNIQQRQRDDMARAMRTMARIRASGERFEAEVAERRERTGTIRPQVVPVNADLRVLPMGLAMVVAYAKGYRDGALAEHYDVDPRMRIEPDRLVERADPHRPGVYLFSNYIWCSEANLELSAAVRAASPSSITVHGGPDTPKYEADVEAFLAAHPHVDVTVRGEGEETLAEALWVLRDAFGDGPVDLSPLRDVPGLSFRLGDEVVHTAPRDRVADLDEIPSPILMGLLDDVATAAESAFVVIETNRGCPYGCTFCDWGSATLSRIRKFDLDRVKAELDWCAEHHIGYIVIGDANFGIFERDVEIAEHIAELKRRHGFPESVGTNYAKNTVKHLSKIIDVFTAAGIIAEGKVSLQTHDESTLLVIKRKNIPVEKYNDLSVEFRRNGLPLAVELMMGLPGSTAASFRSDLQECIDRDVRTMVYPTVNLPNSPMNAPDYREEHGIVAVPGEMVKETTSFTRAEWEKMYRLTMAFIVCETFGALRQIATFARSETGVREVAVYEHILDAAQSDPERYPITRFTLEKLHALMVPPVSWQLLLDEVRTILVDDLGVEDGSALDAAIAAQSALLPARDRVMPDVRELPHDYQSWHAAVIVARGSGHRHDWESVVPRLGTFGPASFRVSDPLNVCGTLNRSVTAGVQIQGGHWEFGNPVSRPVANSLRTDAAPVEAV